jgi:transketolase
MATHHGNQALVMGRSKLAVVLAEDGAPFFAGDYEFDPARADWVRRGEGLTIVCAGNMLSQALDAWNILVADGVRVGVVSIAAWSDLSDAEARALAAIGPIVSVEDHNPKTGLGTVLQARLNELGLLCRVRKLGVTVYSTSGPAKELYALLGLDGPAIARAAREELAREGN